jgi:hypothetical protein
MGIDESGQYISLSRNAVAAARADHLDFSVLENHLSGKYPFLVNIDDLTTDALHVT